MGNVQVAADDVGGVGLNKTEEIVTILKTRKMPM